MIETFDYEVRDGVADQVKMVNSFAITSEVRSASPTDLDVARARLQVLAQANPNQFDLFYIESVLVSTGWNKNDDVFDRREMWNAKSSPVDKQFNFMHNEKDIIGHITSARVIDFEGKSIVTDNFDEAPSDFEIIVGSVLYKTWSDEALQKRMNEIIVGIANNQWYVSMECLFKNFDYAIITPKGENKVVARNKDSAFLTKHLKRYGGNGEYEGYKVGRLLRNFTFSGKGLVDKPANPRSFIIGFNHNSEVQSFATSASILNNLEEIEMADNQETVSKAQYDELKAEFEKIKASIEEKRDSEAKGLQSQIDSLKEANSKLVVEGDANKEIVKAKDEKIVALENEVKTLNESLSTMKSEIEKKNLEAVQAKRKQTLMGKNIADERANELLEKFVSASDDLFSVLVDALPNKEEAKFPEDMKKKDDKKEEDEKKKEKAEDKDVSALDNIEAGKDVDLNIDNSQIESIAGKAAAWLQNQILKTTAGMKKE